MADRDTRTTARVERERDLYLRILELGSQAELEPFLKESLALIVDVTGAEQGYIELRDLETDDGAPAWWISHGCTGSDVENIRSAISQGIIADALATGRTVATASAMLDPRFRERESVRDQKIEAVLCAPIGEDLPIGVVYLQGRPEPGPFSEPDRQDAELFGRHLSPLSDRLLTRQRTLAQNDPTRPFRERIRADEIIGRSDALAVVLREAAAAAPLGDVTVLLTGESGTGKTQLARTLHANSPRAAGPFVELNAAALPESLIENELFGSVKGGHSTASEPVKGKIAAAEGGTLFLDEIGELAISVQAKLLQVLQSREYYPLGSSEPVHADLRVIAATNRNLKEAVDSGAFRADLFYRLEVLTIRMPSLAERTRDIPELARHLCEEASQRNKLPRVELSPGTLRSIVATEWPGNIRQLANAVERGVIRASAEGATRTERRHLFPDHAPTAADEAEVTWQEATARFQKELLEQTLTEANWNVTGVARRLDLARSHIYNLMKTFGIERDDRDDS